MKALRMKKRLKAMVLGTLLLGVTASVLIAGAGGAKQNTMNPGSANTSDASSVAPMGSKAQNAVPLLDTIGRETAMAGHGSSKPAQPATKWSPTPISTSATTAQAVTTLGALAKPQGITAGYVRGEERVWVASLGTRSVVRLEAQSGRVIAAVPLDIAPLGLALADGALWITGGFNTVERLDTRTNRVVARIAVGMNPRIPVANDDAVWIPNADDHTVSRIDPEDNRVVATIPVGDPLACPSSAEPLALAAGTGAVWVMQCGAESVARIDPRTNRLVEIIHIGVEPTGLQLAGDSLWITSRAYDRVLRIDTQSRRVIGSIIIAGPEALTTAAASVWVETSAGSLVQINAQTNQVMNTIALGGGLVTGPPSPIPSMPGVMMSPALGSLAGDEDRVWVSQLGTNVVLRIRQALLR